MNANLPFGDNVFYTLLCFKSFFSRVLGRDIKQISAASLLISDDGTSLDGNQHCEVQNLTHLNILFVEICKAEISTFSTVTSREFLRDLFLV